MLETSGGDSNITSDDPAVKAAGFSQTMINARDPVGHEGSVDAAIDAVRASELRVTGCQVLRDFEGLSGHLHDYKIDIAKAMLQMCHRLGSQVLLVCSSTSQHSTDDLDAIAHDLTKLATLALPLGIRIAYEGLSWGRTINEYTTAWEVVERADWPNLGVALDSFHIIAAKTSLDSLESIDTDKIFLVRLSDFMWQDVATLPTVCQRACNSATWVSQNILRKGAPLPAWTSARAEEPSAREDM